MVYARWVAWAMNEQESGVFSALLWLAAPFSPTAGPALCFADSLLLTAGTGMPSAGLIIPVEGTASHTCHVKRRICIGKVLPLGPKLAARLSFHHGKVKYPTSSLVLIWSCQLFPFFSKPCYSTFFL